MATVPRQVPEHLRKRIASREEDNVDDGLPLYDDVPSENGERESSKSSAVRVSVENSSTCARNSNECALMAVDDREELRDRVDESEKRLEELTDCNERMRVELSYLRDMVDRLLAENQRAQISNHLPESKEKPALDGPGENAGT